MRAVGEHLYFYAGEFMLVNEKVHIVPLVRLQFLQATHRRNRKKNMRELKSAGNLPCTL